MNNISFTHNMDEEMEFLNKYTNVVHNAKQFALKKSANVVKDATISSFKKTGIHYGPNPLYSDTLIDGIRTSRVFADTIKVHIMGTRSKKSGTFRLRFFENGTKDRYQTTYKGHPLKKKRKIGHIGAYNFFETAKSSSISDAEQKFTEMFDKYIEKNS